MANTQQTRTIFQNSNSSSEKNWAFVDMQNFYKGVREKGWKINWAAFRNYLKTTHAVSRAVAFMGYIYENEYFYRLLRNADFVLEFRPVRKLNDGSIDGGNVDADLACYALDNKVKYSKA